MTEQNEKFEKEMETVGRQLKLGRVNKQVTFKSNSAILNDQMIKAISATLESNAEMLGLEGAEMLGLEGEDVFVELGKPWPEWSAEQSYSFPDVIWKYASIWQKLRFPKGIDKP